MNALRTKFINALSSGESVNRKLILVVGFAAAAIIALLMALNSPKPVMATPQVSAPAQMAKLPQIYVHVVGEVKNPGVQSLESDSRVFDAILAAGGFTDKADQASVNLARPVNDGEQIVVLVKGETPTRSAAGTTALISLNRASQTELESLPGVGPTLASRMIDWRMTNGGFKKVDDLKRVTGIGIKLFSQIKDRVTL